jgi:CheY-like chemotaxis protein
MVLSVKDTGSGISEEIMSHIFEPFFTTKAPQGSGLGLAQVYGIVKQHEGYINVETQEGKGATFTIYLPALAVEEEMPEGQPSRDIPYGHDELVLLVEDELAVLEANKAMLNHLGYRVLTASDGRQALEIYEAYQDEIALVLADMVMPKMDGVGLFHALKAEYPDVRVVLTTGYPLEEEAQGVLTEGLADWLQKPMSLARLAQVVDRAIRFSGN